MIEKKKKGSIMKIFVVCLLVLVLISGLMYSVLRYPTKMKSMFIESSVQAMMEKLTDAASYTNRNIEINYDEIELLAGLLMERMNGTDQYSENVLDIMEMAREKAGFTYIGIVLMNADNLYATMSTGEQVQVDLWTIDMALEEGTVSVELQTSPFLGSSEGKDAVIYRYSFQGKGGETYMLIAEKPQSTLNSILNIERANEGVTLMIRDNGNVVYSQGKVAQAEVSSYNIYAYLQQLGATDSQVESIKEQMQNVSGDFKLSVGDEPYYFVFHKIENTSWICINGYSESVMAGENLATVNHATMQLVIIVAAVLILAMVVTLFGVIISVRKQGERKMLERERLFEEMSRYIPSAFAIVRANEKSPSFLSYNFSEVVEDEQFDFTFSGIEKWMSGTDSGDAEDKIAKEGKYKQIVQKGERYISIGIYDIGIIDREKYYVQVFNDVTSDIQSRKLLEDSMRRADEASHSKTHFLSKMSHEIRTPLNSVIGFSRLALDGWNNRPQEELYDYVNKIQISGNYLLELVSDILDISRIEEGKMVATKSPYSLDALVEETVNSFMGQMERKHLQFVVDKNYQDRMLGMDSFHTRQILNNLISNAYKYTEEGGCVGLEVTANPIDEKRMSVQFVVQDTGIGMSEEFLAKIFEPFSQDDRGMQMKKQLRGSGLGMSICKNLVELLDGTIKVESKIGEGTCFTVCLIYDILSMESEKEARNAAEIDYSCLKGKKVLVVDDLEMNRTIIEKFMETNGVVYDEAEDGKQAFERFEQSAAGEYLAIFMDVNMPVMNGLEATEQIRKSAHPDAKKIPIIAMTADAFSDDVNRALMSGMNYHVTKPIQIERVWSILFEISKERG